MKRGRGIIAIMLIASLVATTLMRGLAQHRRDVLIPRPRATSRLSGIDSFALGLILGGLRGPLVMFLWTAIENQKIERNLEDIDTKIELIRMLQSEFDSVIIWQMWNKAYNLSVQMASLPNKYATILDALDYGWRVNEERPDNVNILYQIADTYFTKLGQSAEKRAYIRWVRQQTLPHGQRGVKPGETGFRRTEHDVLLDDKGFILPELLKPRIGIETRREAASRDTQPYDGSELQYLGRYNTPEMGGFPYGVSPLALGYNYYRRTTGLMALTGQKHSQLSDSVIDSRPAIALKIWAEEEWERGRKLELQAMGLQAPDNRTILETMAAAAGRDVKFVNNTPATRKLLDEALFSYRRAIQVGQHAVEEYNRHLSRPEFADDEFTYRSHKETVLAMMTLVAADRAYLLAMSARAGLRPRAEGEPTEAQLLAAARKGYQDARTRLYVWMLRYAVEDAVADEVYPDVTQKLTGTKYNKTTLPQLPPAAFLPLHQATRQYVKKNLPFDSYSDDVAEYESYIQRADMRLKMLEE